MKLSLLLSTCAAAFSSKHNSSSLRCRQQMKHCITLLHGGTKHTKRANSFTVPLGRKWSDQQIQSQAINDDTTKEVSDLTKASIPNLTTSLVKSIVGSGVFALPAGIAAMVSSASSSSENALSSSFILPVAVIIIAAVGATNAYFFSLVGRVCQSTGAVSFKQAWERTVDHQSLRDDSQSTSIWIALVVVLKTFLSCLAYSMILADSFQRLAVTAGFPDVTRSLALTAVTLLALLPLCLLPDLRALAPFSFLGLVGIGVAAVAMTIRWLDGSYNIVTALTSQTLQWPGALVLACTLASAFVAHYNAPRFYAELKNPSTKRFNLVTGVAFILSAVFYMYIALIGFWTFGTSSSGFILNNYSSLDPLMTLSRLAIALSITMSYPLPFTGLRDGVCDLFNLSDEKEAAIEIVPTAGLSKMKTALSIGLLFIVTLCASQIKDLGLVLTVGGGTFSTAVSAVFPALMFVAAKQSSTQKEQVLNSSLGTKVEKGFVLSLMVIAIVIGGSGTYIALNKVT